MKKAGVEWVMILALSAANAPMVWAQSEVMTTPPPTSPPPASLEPPPFTPAPVSSAAAKTKPTPVTAPSADTTVRPAASDPSVARPLTADPSAVTPPPPRTPAPVAPAPTTPVPVTPVPSNEPVAPAPAARPPHPDAGTPRATSSQLNEAPFPPIAASPSAKGKHETPALPPASREATGISQDEDLSPPGDVGVTERGHETRVRHLKGPGIALQVGGGLMDFSTSRMKSLTDHGGYWDVRMVLGVHQLFGFELAYLGSLNPISAPGVEPGSSLVGNGAEGSLRFNVPLLKKDGAYITPFALAGMGWQHYHVDRPTEASLAMLENRSDVVTIPMGGGITIGYDHLYLDTRFVYRFTHEDLARQSDNRERLRQWTFGGNFGYVF